MKVPSDWINRFWQMTSAPRARPDKIEVHKYVRKVPRKYHRGIRIITIVPDASGDAEVVIRGQRFVIHVQGEA